jgi:hypothetical protein
MIHFYINKAFVLFFLLFISNVLNAQYINNKNNDPRCIDNGSVIPSFTYSDQPYVIVCNDGSWLCVMTTSSGLEYAYMNHIIATKSYDKGKTWTNPINIEPPGAPQSSWAVPLKIPNGRIYVFYNYNQYHFTGLEGVMSGPFMFRYSDDNGNTWSENRYEVPIRTTKIDRENYTKGKNQFFWSIDKPIVTENAAYITFTKILRTSPGQSDFFKRSEGFILKSENIIKENDPRKINWQTLPQGDEGIRNPNLGYVQAEHNMVILNNGSLYVVCRTIDGSPAYSISTDGGKTFSVPEYMVYENGERMGNPRACPKIHKTINGKYLFWFHNNFRKNSYDGRNPVWLSGGIEQNGNIVWSQPEILLYDMDPTILGMSYPDFIEQDGRFWITETQKDQARVHEISNDLIQGLLEREKYIPLLDRNIILNADDEMLSIGKTSFPQLPDPLSGGSFTFEMWTTIDDFISECEVFSTIGAKRKGVKAILRENNTIEFEIDDGKIREKKLDVGRKFISDDQTIKEGQLHHIVLIIDGAAKIGMVVVDGILSDGGVDTRDYGWGRILPHIGDLNDTNVCTLNEEYNGKIHSIRLYNRALKISEVIYLYRKGLK